VEIRNSWGPVKITAQHSATFQKCTCVFDEQKRFAPRFAPELQMSMHADHVILAIGQAAELSALTGSAVKIERGLIVTDTARTTSECGVFAGGDVNYGPRTVVEAVLAGKQAAEAIDAYLAGRLVDPLAAESHSRAQVPPLATGAHERSSRQRSEMPERDVWERKGTYQRIELGLTDEMAHAEAARCLRCDLCIGCGMCELTCSEVGAEALRMVETSAGRLVFDDFTRPFNKCVGCGACSQVCPTGAIHVEDKDGVRATVITGTIVQQQPILKCR
jgi:ferredoxin